jgi:hypothetical protein
MRHVLTLPAAFLFLLSSGALAQQVSLNDLRGYSLIINQDEVINRRRGALKGGPGTSRFISPLKAASFTARIGRAMQVATGFVRTSATRKVAEVNSHGPATASQGAGSIRGVVRSGNGLGSCRPHRVLAARWTSTGAVVVRSMFCAVAAAWSEATYSPDQAKNKQPVAPRRLDQPSASLLRQSAL